MQNILSYLPLVAKILITLAFVAAGGAKLAGAAPMVEVFETVGLGQWFRYLTGIIEVGAAVLLWVPGLVAIGAALLVVTMIGAIIAHLAILGPSFVPALVLGLLAAYVGWTARRPGT